MAWANDRVIGYCTMNVCGWGGGGGWDGGVGGGGETRSGVVMAKLLDRGEGWEWGGGGVEAGEYMETWYIWGVEGRDGRGGEWVEAGE